MDQSSLSPCLYLHYLSSTHACYLQFKVNACIVQIMYQLASWKVSLTHSTSYKDQIVWYGKLILSPLCPLYLLRLLGYNHNMQSNTKLIHWFSFPMTVLHDASCVEEYCYHTNCSYLCVMSICSVKEVSVEICGKYSLVVLSVLACFYH